MSMRIPAIALAVALLAATAAHADGPGQPRTVAAGSTWVVPKTTTLPSLVVEQGAKLEAPPGKSLTLTIDGTETGLGPVNHAGHIVLSVTEAFPVKFDAMGANTTHWFRQALFLDAQGVNAAKSVTAAAGPYHYKDGTLTGVAIHSVGESFNGIVAAGGTHVIKGATIDFLGNGGNDFAGYGAAILSLGKGTTLVVDGAKIRTHGAIRTAAVADGGSHLVVKNSQLESLSGQLPAGYRSNVTPGDMKDAPWMLGIVGNVRTTNLLGDRTTATYINSSIASEEWGVLSVDNGQNTRLTAIDSRVSNSGASGYGSYAIGNSTNSFYGTEFHVATYAQIVTGGDVYYGASTPEAVARLNGELALGLTPAELAALPTRQSEVHSARFGVMWHGQGKVTVRDGTVLDTALTTFLVKGAVAKIDVDGSKGAQLRPHNGVLVQLIDNDDPGPGNDHGLMVNNGVYHEPKDAPAKVASFDVAKPHDTDVVAHFSAMHLKGDLYNGIRGGLGGRGSPGVELAPGGSGSGGGGGSGGPPAGLRAPASPGGTNLVVELVDDTELTGTVSASVPRHVKDTIGAADFALLGVVSNTASPAVNNGVLVTLHHSSWTVTGTSHLTALALDATSKVQAAAGHSLAMTVDGKETAVAPGSYQGAIVLEVK